MGGLSDYLTSEYISRLRYYTHDRTVDIVMVYVEGNEDVCFWRSALLRFGNTNKYEFRVVTNKMSIGDDAPNGKVCLLKMSNVGKNKVICVDADWDLLVDGYSDYTETVRNSKFVINTTYYSIENILLSPEFHASLMRKLGLTEMCDKYKKLLEWVSGVCEELFVLMLSYAEEGSHNRSFWFDDFGQYINGVSVRDLGDINKTDYYISTWKEKNSVLISHQVDLMQKIRIFLDAEGYISKDLWKLIRGHNLYASFIKPWIKEQYKLCNKQKIENYKKEHGFEGLEVFCRSLAASLGEYKSVNDAIDANFYENFPDPIWLPKETKIKILHLFS